MRLARPLVWTGLVLLLGSAYFSAELSGSILLPALRALAPALGHVQPHHLHAGIRKAAHVTEYGLLAVLWFQALAWRRSAVTASWIALAICLACAVADEAHQSLLPDRTASARDVAIDTLGAAAAVSIVRRRRERLEAQGVPPAARLPYARVA
jgi:VanZ family protein